MDNGEGGAPDLHGANLVMDGWSQLIHTWGLGISGVCECGQQQTIKNCVPENMCT